MSFERYGDLDTRVAKEGDSSFTGIDSYREDVTLESGFVSASENMRMDGDRAQVRKGLDFLAGSVTLTYSVGDEEIFATGRFSDPNNDNLDWLALATKTKLILWNSATASGKYVTYGGGATVTTAHKASIMQAFNKVYIFRSGARPLEWDGVMTDTNADGTVDSTFAAMSGSASGSGSPIPNADWGVYFRNRIIVPNPDTIDSGVTNNAQTIVMSDILTPNNFSVESEFYLNHGAADFIVGAAPYQEDQLIAFNRRSIFIINNITTTSAAGVFEVTRQYGCCARKSIAQSGPQTYFLSDGGVYVLSPGVDPAKGLGIAISKTQGETIPLSRPIQDVMATVNFDEAAISKSVGIVHDNKYYLAIPTGSNTSPNKVLVYDILLSAWVSVDSFPSGFTVDDFAVMPYGSNPKQNRLFIGNTKGFYLYEENTLDETGTVGNASITSTAIPAKLTTRGYNYGMPDVKTFYRGQLGATVSASDAFTVTTNGTDPDSSEVVLTEVATAAEDTLYRFGLRRRAYSLNLEINVTAGRPTFRHIAVEASGEGMRTRKEVA